MHGYLAEDTHHVQEDHQETSNVGNSIQGVDERLEQGGEPIQE